MSCVLHFNVAQHIAMHNAYDTMNHCRDSVLFIVKITVKIK